MRKSHFSATGLSLLHSSAPCAPLVHTIGYQRFKASGRSSARRRAAIFDPAGDDLPPPAALSRKSFPSARQTHSLLLRGVAVGKVTVAANVAQAQIIERPGAAFRQRQDMLDGCGATRIGVATVEHHRMSAAPAIVPVARANLPRPLLAFVQAENPARQEPVGGTS